MSKQKSYPWIVVGGRIGEMAHCQRCGSVLSLSLPQPMTIVAVTIKKFEKIHERCLLGSYKEPQPRTPREWANGRDVGVSSMTIWSVMTKRPSPYDSFSTHRDGGTSVGAIASLLCFRSSALG
jgi:hypothetical protein